MKINNIWSLKGNIATGTLFLIGLMILMGIVGGMMTKGLVPTNVPANKGVVVTPVFNTPASNESNLQLNSFGFVSPVPTQTPAPQSSDAL
jgi:hypothetical protein